MISFTCISKSVSLGSTIGIKKIAFKNSGFYGNHRSC